MKTTLQHRFGIVRDVRHVECPFGPGIFLDIRRKSHPAVQEWAEKVQAGNPLIASYFRELTKAQTKIALRNKGEKVNQEAIIDKVFEGDRPIEDLRTLADLNRSNLERIAVYVEGFEGLTWENGEPVPFSTDNVIAMLGWPELMNPADPFGSFEIDQEDGSKKTVTRTLGAAIGAWIESEAEDGDAYIEAAGKNSAASSAIEPASSKS